MVSARIENKAEDRKLILSKTSPATNRIISSKYNIYKNDLRAHEIEYKYI